MLFVVRRCLMWSSCFFFSSRKRHTRCALVTGVQTCALPISLHLAAMALGLGPADAVVVPTLTFLATANAARYVGAEVVFADVDPDTGLTGPEHVLRAIARAPGRVRAVFPVHLNGQAADIAAIADALPPGDKIGRAHV